MATEQPVVVLGADVEGLVAAALLARGGRRVIVVERRELAGGTGARLEFHPGHSVPGLHHDPGLARRALLAPLELERHGLAWRSEPALHVPGEDGNGACIGRGAGRARDRGELVGADGDAGPFAAWHGFLDRLTPLVERILDEPVPDAVAPGVGELLRLARTAFRLRALGQRDMLELLRIAPMCAQDWMHENFTSPLVRAGIVAPCLQGTVLGPRAAGTSALVLLAECARGPEPVGGTAALVDALVAACRDAGVELRLGTEAKHIRLSPTGVEGIELADGETIAAGVVASAEDPGHTLLELVPGAGLPPQVERAVANWRTRGSSAMLLVALSAPPRFPGCARGAPAGIPERIIGAHGLRELERTADHLKYGRLPEKPWLDVRVWSAGDPACAPAGAATLSVLMHGVPYALDGGWSEDARTRLVAAGLARLEHLAPGVRDALVACELLTPVDLEERYATAGGHLHRGELALDQLWLQRPSLALSRYATPIPGLYLCGSASHPGGPFLGGAGALAARSVLAG